MNIQLRYLLIAKNVSMVLFHSYLSEIIREINYQNASCKFKGQTYCITERILGHTSFKDTDKVSPRLNITTNKMHTINHKS